MSSCEKVFEKTWASMKSPMEEFSSTLDLSQRPRRRRLPVEMECEIFKCLKLPLQFKFIWGMGRGVYGMFGQRLLLIKSKRLCNPEDGNRWNPSEGILISPDGLQIRSNAAVQHVFAEKGFAISGEHCRKDGFPGTIVYYYEVTHMPSLGCSYDHLPTERKLAFLAGTFIGLTDGSIPVGLFPCIGFFSNSYALGNGRDFVCHLLSGKKYYFEGPTTDSIIQQRHGFDDVAGCGLVLSPTKQIGHFLHHKWPTHGQAKPFSPRLNDPSHQLYCIIFNHDVKWSTEYTMQTHQQIIRF